MKKFLLVCFFLLVSNVMQAHPFHVSVCELEFNSTSQRYEMAMKIFTDDFTQALKSYQKGLKEYELLGDDKTLQSVALEYINTYFVVLEGEENLQLEFVGKEGDEDAVWFYFELETMHPNEALHIKNMILFDQFDDQSNLLHYRCGEESNSYMFKKSNVAQSVVCKD